MIDFPQESASDDRLNERLQNARLNGNARAQVVNRTHRVVREQAMNMREQKSRSRSLWAPLMISSSLLMVILYAAWGTLDGYDLTPSGMPDSSYQMFLFLLWLMPVTALVLGMVWVRRGRNHANGEAPR
ncbi:MAG TPA: hypothetical protein VIJ65_02580 [Acidobacteriaceae bacterium]